MSVKSAFMKQRLRVCKATIVISFRRDLERVLACQVIRMSLLFVFYLLSLAKLGRFLSFADSTGRLIGQGILMSGQFQARPPSSSGA